MENTKDKQKSNGRQSSGATCYIHIMDSKEAYEAWLRTVCFQKPTSEAYDLAKKAWQAGIK